MNASESNSSANEMKEIATGIFVNMLKNKMTIKQKYLKFYNIQGHDMANVVLDFPCTPEGHETSACPGCSLCNEDRDAFASQYNILTSEFKSRVIKQFKDTVEKSHNKNSQKEMDY
jgi:hypothetical protein